jgi:hypothetical protein
MVSHNQTLQRRAAATARWRGPDSSEAIDAKRASKAAALETYVARVVSEAPPLTAEQLDRVAVLLRGVTA